MDIQELYLRSYEFFLEEDSNPMTNLEYQFIIDKINKLNGKEFLSEKEKYEAEILFAILLNFDKESSIEFLKLSKEMHLILDKIYIE